MSTPFEDKREEALEEEDSFEDSTIFSAPEEKHDKVEKPKLWRKILLGAGVLVALAAAIVAIVMLVAQIADDDDTEQAVIEWYMLSDYVTLSDTTGTDGTVTKTEMFNFDAFKKVELKSEKLDLEFYVKEDEEANRTWLEKSIAQEYTSETTVEGIVEAALGLKYTRVISETVEDNPLYGFDKPAYTIVITPNEGEAFTVTVGKQSPDQSGYYVTISNGTKVYLVRNKHITDLELDDKMELTKALTVEAFSQTEGSAEYYGSGVLAKFDYIYFKNPNLDATYKFITVERSGNYSYNTYKIVEPIERAGNDVEIVSIVELFSNGIESTGLYSVTKTEQDIKKFGLDDPDMQVSIKAGKQEREIKAKLQADGNYALVASDMDVILKVSSASLSPITLTQKDIYSQFIFIETLAELSQVTIESDGNKTVFGINTEKNENDADEVTGITVNGGEEMASEEFMSYYQFLLGINAINYDQTDLTGKTPAAKITLTRKDGTVSYVIEYYEAQNGRYQAVVNGNQMGLIGSSNFKNIVKYANNVAEGRLYNS